MTTASDPQPLNVAVFGDLFVRPMLMEAALMRRLTPLGFALEIRAAEVDWPTRPLTRDDEVAEYVGDPEQVICDPQVRECYWGTEEMECY